MIKGTKIEYCPWGYDSNGNPVSKSPYNTIQKLTFQQLVGLNSEVMIIATDENNVIWSVKVECCKIIEEKNCPAILG